MLLPQQARARICARERGARRESEREGPRAREKAAVAGEGAGGPRACAASSQALSAAPFATERARVCRAAGCALRWVVAHPVFTLEGRLLREEPPHVLRLAVAGRVEQLLARHFCDVLRRAHGSRAHGSQRDSWNYNLSCLPFLPRRWRRRRRWRSGRRRSGRRPGRRSTARRRRRWRRTATTAYLRSEDGLIRVLLLPGSWRWRWWWTAWWGPGGALAVLAGPGGPGGPGGGGFGGGGGGGGPPADSGGGGGGGGMPNLPPGA